MARIRQAWRRLGEQQRYVEPSWHSLERIQHQQRLVSWCRHRIRLQVALDRQTRIRLSRAIKLDFSHGPFGGFEAAIFKWSKPGSTTSSRAAFPRTVCAAEPHSAEPSEDEDLPEKSQNPIADLVSVPFQSNTNFNAGPFNRTQEVLNIQPVVPHAFQCDDWNVISRTIIPLVSQPSPIFDSNTNGIGDITQSLFLLPHAPGQALSGALVQSSLFRPPMILSSGPVDVCSARRPC